MKSGCFDRRPVITCRLRCGILLLSSSGSLGGEFTFLCGTLENVVGRISCQWLNAHKLPAIFAKAIHVAASKRATPLGRTLLIYANQRFNPFNRNTPTIINICNLVRPLSHSMLLSCARHFCKPKLLSNLDDT